MALQISAEFPGLMSLAVPIVLVNRYSSDYPSLFGGKTEALAMPEVDRPVG